MARKQFSDEDRRSLRNLGRASTIGLTLVISSALGFGFGWWLDGKLHTQTPWFTLVFGLMGVAAGFLEMFKAVSDINKDE
ncbi:MAG TPA: AtpZ/AtpI family protein [Armatimonadota bacterium]|jgi:F0F1-type ATP synthase assembly protein I